MSAYCFRAKMVQFSKGQSAVHTAAYNARTELEHRAENRQTRDYGGHDEQDDLIFTGIFAPKDAPEWVNDRGELWNRAEEAERQKANGQPARNIMLALPQELSEEARLRLVKGFVREAFVRKGMIADVNIHAPDIERGDDPRNFHAHILLTTRTLDGDHFSKTKTDARDWNKGGTLDAWREKWAHMGANALEKEASNQLDPAEKERLMIEAARYREGHKTHEKQAEAALARGDAEWFEHHKERTASLHNGPAVTEMERKGLHTDRGDENREIAERNAAVQELRAVQAEREKDALGKGAGQIRMAKALSNSVDGFIDNLHMRGMTLAVVSQEEALASERKAAFAQELGNRSARLKAGEVVAVNQWGNTYRLTGRTLGETPQGAEKFVAGIDKAALLDVATSADALKEASREAFIFEQAAKRERQPLSKVAGQIRLAKSLSENVNGFVQNLRERGLSLAVVSSADVYASERRAAFAQEVGNYAKPLTEGELVAVTKWGGAYKLGARTLGGTPESVQDYLAGVDTAALSGVYDTADSLRIEDALKRRGKPARTPNGADMVTQQAFAQQRFERNTRRATAAARPKAPATLTPWSEDRAAFDAGRDITKRKATGLTVTLADGQKVPLAEHVDQLRAKLRPEKRLPHVAPIKLLNDPALSRRYDEQDERDRKAKERENKALERIGSDLKSGRSLRASDVKNLTRETFDRIQEKGDKALREKVDDRRKENDRQRDGGRERERD